MNKNNLTNAEELQELIQDCIAETKTAHEVKYDAEQAEKTAAMFLHARLLLAQFIEDVELNAKQSKGEIDRIEGEKYFHYKETINSDKKVTEAVLVAAVARDSEVVQAKKNWASSEAELRKYSFIMDTLKEGHIFFRNVGKGKNEF